MHEVLTDGSIQLRAFRAGDAAFVADACRSAPDIVTWVMRLPSLDEAGAREWIGTLPQSERDRERITRAVVDVQTDELLGSIWLGRFDHEARRAELAYWTAPGARDRGVATAAVRLMARFGFHELGLLRVEILAATQNRTSQRVAEKARFTKEGVLRSYRNIAGEQTDLVMYSLLRSDLAESLPQPQPG